jgi:hypothetical protein
MQIQKYCIFSSIFSKSAIFIYIRTQAFAAHEILTSVIFTNNKSVGLNWALSLANPISCLGSVPRDLFKSFRAGGIL